MDEFAIVEGKTRLKVRGGSRQTITDEQVETFFETLADTCNVVRSAKAAGFTANWAYRKRKFDAAFRDGWASALAEGYAKLELVLMERAIKGTPKLVRASGGKDRTMREYACGMPTDLVEPNYRLRGNYGAVAVHHLLRHFRRVTRGRRRAGDLLFMMVADEQLHVGILTDGGFVHADARLRKVVETPGEPEWRVIGFYRRRVRRKK